MLSTASTATTNRVFVLLVTGLLLAAFVIATVDLHRESLWNDEAWTAWAIRSPYLRDTLERVQADVHPPLYFLALSAFGRFTGDSELALRWPSALFNLIGLATTYAVGKHLFDKQTGLIALILLGTASFFVYYAREARMYSLLMALGVLATLFYVRWRARPSLWRTILYGLSMAALLYTHYAGVFIIVTHLLHVMITQFNQRTRLRAKWYWLLFPYILATILFAPWVPTFLSQMRSNPNGPLAIPVPTNWATVAGLVLILTSGSWGLMVAPFVLGNAISRIWQYASTILLLALWLLITPICLLALNMWFAPVYQVRYAIGMLPAGALLLAYGLRHIELPNKITIGKLSARALSAVIAITLIVWLAYTQLTMLNELWPLKPPWEATIQRMITARNPLDATITDLAAYSPAAYYDRQLGLKHGIGLDLSWRLHTPDEVSKLVSKLDSVPVVWIALPVNTAKSWRVVAQLAETRHVGYRSSLGNMLFYQFRQGKREDLRFQFGDLVALESAFAADQQIMLQAGKQLCVKLDLQTLKGIDNSYSVGLHLVDITGNINAAQWDNGLGARAANERVSLLLCLDIPTDTPPGDYHLELTVYNWSTVERLPVLDIGGDSTIGWGDVLMMQSVNIQQ